MQGLATLLLLLLAAVLMVVVCKRLGIPPILGYIWVGILIGPHTLGLMPESETTAHLAEIGIVFLMFSVGLEFSLTKLNTMRRAVFVTGGLQVILCLAAGLFILSFIPTGLAWQSHFVLAALFVMSSTAIVVKLLSERMSTDTPHGRSIIGILLFQDLAVIPLLVLIPALAQPAEVMAMRLGAAVLKAAVVLLILLWLGQRVLQAWFDLIARQASRELFTLNVLLITLGLAWLTESLGVSLALGAFVAGMLIAETQYKHAVEEDIKPFRDILLGLFFVTLGMQLNFAVLQQHTLWVLAFLVIPLLVKLVVVLMVVRGIPSFTEKSRAKPKPRPSLGTALRTSLALCTAGEFGFVLLSLAAKQNLLPADVAQSALAAMILSMLLTPVLVGSSEWIVSKTVRSDWALQSLSLTQLASKSMMQRGHVVILGFGHSGQGMAKLLRAEHKAFVALDLDPDIVAAARETGENVQFGDAQRSEMLQAMGIARAGAVVITVAQFAAQRKIIHDVRSQNTTVPIIVRTQDEQNLDELYAAGANEVVPETREGSLLLAHHTLIHLGLPVAQVEARVLHARAGAPGRTP